MESYEDWSTPFCVGVTVGIALTFLFVVLK